jgi:signal transduction histidine kinase
VTTGVGQASSERQQTDESLRAEREKADQAVDDELSAVDEVADTVISRARRRGKVAVRVEQSGEELRFSVSDSGAGIPAERLESVFERYVQLDKTDRRGLGLGLYISKCIVQGHAGRIWAESTPGRGSKFCFALPLAKTGKATPPLPHSR